MNRSTMQILLITILIVVACGDSQSGLVRHNFDISGSSSNDWSITRIDGEHPQDNAAVIFRPGLGINGTDAVDLFVSGNSRESMTEIASRVRIEAQPGLFELNVRYKTIGSIGGDHPGFYAGYIGYQSETAHNASGSRSAAHTLIRSPDDWATARIEFEVPAESEYRYVSFRCGFTDAPIQDAVRIDSFSVRQRSEYGD